MKVLFFTAIFVILFNLNDCVKGRGRNVDLTTEDESMIVMYHNDVRRNVTGASNMKEMQWDPEIARLARDWGSHCIYQRPYDDNFGENLFYKRYRKRDKVNEVVMDAIGAWLQQKDVHVPGSRGCRRAKTCKYVQLITADTESVGCTVTKCPTLHIGKHKKKRNVYYVLCFYKPWKSITEEIPHRTGRKCSKCPKGYTCQNDLCVPPQEEVQKSIQASEHLSSKHRKHHKSRQLQAPSAEIVVRNDVNLLPVNHKDNRFESQGLPEKQINYNRHPAPQNRISNRRVKRQTYERYDPYEERRRQLYLERERRRRLDPRYDDRVYSEQRRRQELEREQRRRLQLEEQRARRDQQRRAELEEQRRAERAEQRRAERERRRRARDPRAQQVGGCEAVYGPGWNLGSNYHTGPYLNGRDRDSVLEAHNDMRRGQGLPSLAWDPNLQRWANYVIRCDIEYPGPITDYTNFGKVDSRRELVSVVNNWGSEGDDLYQRLANGCRTPYDRELCNHYRIVMKSAVDRIGCSSLDCGSRRQLTCIYRESAANPFRRRG